MVANRFVAPWRFRSAGALLGVALTVASLSACAAADRVSAARFCEEIQLATGPEGAENLMEPRNPERLETTIDELKSLAETAPSEIDATTQRMVEIFEDIQRTPRSEVTDVLAAHQTEMQRLSEEFNAFSAKTCQVDLRRGE